MENIPELEITIKEMDLPYKYAFPMIVSAFPGMGKSF
jgi:hypothetical protein